ncbi:hypothetical protein BDW72DRAFT_197483 [Aspergillus terricola var. indicus]
MEPTPQALDVHEDKEDETEVVGEEDEVEMVDEAAGLELFALTLFYLPAEGLGQRGIAISIYIGFLMRSVIPQFYDALGGFDGLAKSEREWLLVFFVAGHLARVNPVLTVLALLSAAFQARRILQGPVANKFSAPSLAAQAIIFALVAVSWVWRV